MQYSYIITLIVLTELFRHDELKQGHTKFFFGINDNYNNAVNI